MTPNVNYRRRLVIIPVGKSNQIARKNYQISVLDQSTTITWATRSDQAKTLKLWNEMSTGDAVVFLYNKKAMVAGKIVRTYEDSSVHSRIGWHNGVGFDLIIEMEKVNLNETEILTLLNYGGTPSGLTIASGKKAEAFWDKHGALFPYNTSSSRPTPPVQSVRNKTPQQEFTDRARSMTEGNWKRHQAEIDPQGLGRNESWHLDHKFSIAAAYKIGMPSWLVADAVNLHIIPAVDNLSKSDTCGSIEPLLRAHPEYRYLEAKYKELISGGCS